MKFAKLYPGQFFQAQDFPNIPRSFYENSLGFISYVNELITMRPQLGRIKLRVTAYIVRQGKGGKARLNCCTINTLYLNNLVVAEQDTEIVTEYLNKRTNLNALKPDNLLTIPDLYFIAWVESKITFFKHLLKNEKALNNDLTKFSKMPHIYEIMEMGAALQDDYLNSREFMNTDKIEDLKRRRIILLINEFSSKFSWYINNYHCNIIENAKTAEEIFKNNLATFKAKNTLKLLNS